MDNLKDTTKITIESVLLAIEEATAKTTEKATAEVKEMIAASRAEFDQKSAASSEKFDRELEKSRAEFNQRRAEFDEELKKSRAEHDKIIKDLSKQIGGIANSNGAYAEEFFYNALLHGQRNIFGEEFEDVVKSNKVTINKGYEDEYDILLVNGQAVCVVEIKYKADSSDLPQQLLRKSQTFRVNFPQHKNKKVYLALAGMSFNPLTEKACAANGIAIMKQVGDTMVVSDENLKTF
jgi:hypothetical protein